MSKNVIFCFSGSGNCLDIAENIAKALGDTEIIMMRAAPIKTDVRYAKRVGFVFPCHAGGLPGNVKEYVRRISVDKNAYTFGVCSYAGYLGTGLREIDNIIHLDYWAGIPHYCSCIWLLPSYLTLPPVPSAKAAQGRSEKMAAKIAKEILVGRRKDKAPPKNPLNVAEASLWPKMRVGKGEKMRVEDSCIGCGQCVKLCPQGNIKIENGKAKIGNNCIQCLSCLQYCPQKAIDLGGVSVKRKRYHNSKVTAEELAKDIIVVK